MRKRLLIVFSVLLFLLCLSVVSATDENTNSSIVAQDYGGNVFLPTLMAGFVTDVYAEILARICKETSTSFFVTSVIPLIPGSTLYYCMNSIVEGNTVRALEYGRDTFLFAFGIAAGMSIAWSICYFLRTVRKKQN